jgi:hypothetical protein
MSRGLGKRQRDIISRLEAMGKDGHWPGLPIHVFCEGLGDGDHYYDYWHNSNEYTKVRSAIRGLKDRELVSTYRDKDPNRRVKTKVVTGNQLDGYRAEKTDRAWSGTWVVLRGPTPS